MSRLPIVSGKTAIKKFQKVGYVITRQKGSHVRLRRESKGGKAFTVPLHDVLKPGLLRQLIRDAGLTVEEFLRL